jgi:hypothetical protein
MPKFKQEMVSFYIFVNYDHFYVNIFMLTQATNHSTQRRRVAENGICGGFFFLTPNILL